MGITDTGAMGVAPVSSEGGKEKESSGNADSPVIFNQPPGWEQPGLVSGFTEPVGAEE